jgi:SAM-dependent methyltransferase
VTDRPVDRTGDDPLVRADPVYLRRQYADPGKLTARANLHVKYGTAQTNWFDWLLSQVPWTGHADVLEVGCGPGWLWTRSGSSRPTDARLTLVDISAGMVEVARKAVHGVPGVELDGAHEADVQRLPFSDDSFDVVVANHMLYHAADPDRAVGEIARVLRPDGCLLAALNGRANLEQLFAIRAEVFGGPATDPSAERFGKETGRPVLEKHFDSVQWRDYDDELRCTDVGDIVAYLTSTPPGADASKGQLGRLSRVTTDLIAAGSGALAVTKDTGAFVATGPLR